MFIELGDLERAIDLSRQGAEARQRGDPETIANAELNLADIFLAKVISSWQKNFSMASTASYTIRQPAIG